MRKNADEEKEEKVNSRQRLPFGSEATEKNGIINYNMKIDEIRKKGEKGVGGEGKEKATKTQRRNSLRETKSKVAPLSNQTSSIA